MKKLITLILLSVFILSGCGQENADSGKENKEITQLKEENKKLKEKISELEGNKPKDSAEGVSEGVPSEMGINECHFVRKDSGFDVDMKYVIRKYGYLETLAGYGGGLRTTDGKFLVLEVYVENTGKKEYRVDSYCLVTDDQDREYECVDVKIFDKENEEPISEKNLKPGFNTTAYLAFEVPSSFEVDKFLCYTLLFDLAKIQELGGVIQIDTDQLEESQFEFLAK